MASDNGSCGNTGKNPKKANLLDQHSIKQLLDETVTEIVSGKGYPEDVRLSNLRLLIGAVIIAIALFAQFYPRKFPQNKDLLLACIGLYPFFFSREIQPFFFLEIRSPFRVVLCKATYFDFFMIACSLTLSSRKYILFNVLLQFISYTKEKNAILFTYPPPGSFHSTGLVVSSKLPRFSDMYTLTVESADPKSIAANKPIHLTKSVTKWFTKDGILVEGLFWKDVEKLIDDYAADRKSK